MRSISLNGAYRLFQNDEYVCEATVPGSDFGALVRAKKIRDPLRVSSEKEYEEITKPVYSASHRFESSFVIGKEDLSYSHVVLYCGKLDTLCTCRINGKTAFSSDNAYVSSEHEIKDLLREGENTIEFEFASATGYITARQKKNPLPKNFNGIDGAAYIRKPACHFGWDWGPCLPYKYVGDTRILCFDKRIENVRITQSTTAEKALLTVKADNCVKKLLISPDGREYLFDGDTAEIEKPSLWYTRDLLDGASPALYTLILEGEDEIIKKKIGLRRIELNREKDEFGENFQFLLNGKRVFAKGANLVPFSAIPDVITNETADRYLDMAVKANFNMLRVWGGADYANEYLLERCDELGILIWQDFPFACLMYPLGEKDYLENVFSEIEQNVSRMDSHPCLALWCGNNELEAMFSWMPRTLPLVKAYIDFFFKSLPKFLDGKTGVPYIPSSPLGSAPFRDNSSDDVGDTHMWNVWHGMKPLDYYGKRYTRFLSEFGLESLPSLKAIATFAPSNQRDLASPAFMSHQKCKGGNAKMLYYLRERFFMPLSFDYLPYMTGIVQSECVRFAAEHFRRNKGRCNGALFWQFNDVWNCPSWAAVDYEGIQKALMYHARRFFAPVSISYDDGVFCACNDTMTEKRLEAVININGTDHPVSEVLEPDSVRTVFSYRIEKGDVVQVKWDGLDLCLDRVPKLSPAHFTVRKGKDSLLISSDVYAKNVCLLADADFEDNYFSLLPGEERKVSFSGNADGLRIICENNILTERKPVKRALDRLLFALKPENIANAVYYENN